MTRKQPRDTKYERWQKHDQAIDVDRRISNSAVAFQTFHLPPHLDAYPERWNQDREENPRDADEPYAEKRQFREPSHVILQGVLAAFAERSPTPEKRRRFRSALSSTSRITDRLCISDYRSSFSSFSAVGTTD